MPTAELEVLKDCFVKQLSPLKVYLFGSCAEGTDKPDSDFDFYIVVSDEHADTLELACRASQYQETACRYFGGHAKQI